MGASGGGVRSRSGTDRGRALDLAEQGGLAWSNPFRGARLAAGALSMRYRRAVARRIDGGAVF